MNPKLGIVVVALALAALGVSAFALTKSQKEPPRDVEPVSRNDDAALRALEARLARLEDGGDDARVRDRLDELERRLNALTAPNDEPIAGGPLADLPDVEEPVAVPRPEGDLTDEEVERFLKLQEAAALQRKVKQYTARIGGSLKKAGVELTAEESEKLVTTFIGFEKRRQAAWAEVKRGNPPQSDWPRLIVETSEMLNREFSQQISGFIPGESVQTVAQTLVPIRRGDGRK